MPSTVLVTGGAGFIGSHTCLALMDAGHNVVVVDDFSNSSESAIDRIRELGDSDKLVFHRVDLRDFDGLDQVLHDHPVDAAVHFAGLKAVGESVARPLDYWDVNVGSTMTLLRALGTHGVRTVVFSSSATVYGDPNVNPIPEDSRIAPTNPYGRTKAAVEWLLDDMAASDERWHIALLRYFNPVGAHPSGRIGEDPSGIPNNLMPYLMQVAVGRRPELVIFGDDYPTPDGTGIRDYIHVLDLAEGHVAALDALSELPGCRAVNLGTGQGTSVLEALDAARRVSGCTIPHRVGPRRPGDVASTVADASLAKDLFGWKATRGIDEMCTDAWRWQSQNPNGYAV
ncbi:MAG TPA: UDP-glucose 4-epimerase GalE [Acidimicrobiia bacterium]